MYEEETAAPVVSEQARLQYRADSLMNENRRLQDQVDAPTAENRNMTARNAELETKLAEAAAPAPAPVVTDPSEAYRAALGQFNAREYSGALEVFSAILGSGSAGELADNCQYWMGECYYGMGRYSEALQPLNVDGRVSARRALPLRGGRMLASALPGITPHPPRGPEPGPSSAQAVHHSRAR